MLYPYVIIYISLLVYPIFEGDIQNMVHDVNAAILWTSINAAKYRCLYVYIYQLVNMPFLCIFFIGRYTEYGA
jgi:hypothetical protein